jgi:hypothetical protein
LNNICKGDYQGQIREKKGFLITTKLSSNEFVIRTFRCSQRIYSCSFALKMKINAV